MKVPRRGYHRPGSASGTWDIGRTRSARAPAVIVIDYDASGVVRREGLGDGFVISFPDHTDELLRPIEGRLLMVRKTAWAAREVVSELLRHRDGEQAESVRAFLQDAYDHSVAVIGLVETQRDIATNPVDVYLSAIGNRMNEVIKLLTLVAITLSMLGMLLYFRRKRWL